MKIRAIAAWLSISVVVLAVAGCKSNSAVNTGAPVITVQPASTTTVTVGASVTYTVTATGAPTLMYQWFKNGLTVTGATSSSYDTGTLAITDNNDFFFVYVSNSLGSVESAVANLIVNPASSSSTVRSDNARTALNSNEVTLTPANVNPAGFGKSGFFRVDGAVDAQPLYLSEVNVPGKGVHNILFVATENDTLYAFDAFSGAALWRANVAGPGETPGDNSGCDPASPNAGISATPVIDRTRGPNGAIYLIAKSRDAAGIPYERLHALDVSTGAELFGGPTTIPVSLTGGEPAFDAARLKAQAGMLALNGHVYAEWAPSCAPTSTISTSADGAWILAFDAGNLSIKSTLNTAPPSSQAGAKDSAPLNGGMLAADALGNLFLAGLGSVQLPIIQNMAPGLGSNGNIATGPVLLLPDMTDASGKVWRLAVNVGADGNIYLLDRDAQEGGGTAANAALSGHLNDALNGVVQRIDAAFPSGAAPAGLAYINNTVYVAAAGSGVRAYSVTNARLSAAPKSQSSGIFGPGGASISASAHGSTSGSANAIVWVLEGGDSGVLHAYDAADLSRELYNSKQAENGRDGFGPGNASAMPLVINGRVYVVTTNGVTVFGLLK